MSNIMALSPETIKQAIRYGFLITAIANEPKLRTVDLIPHLLENPISSNETLKPYFPNEDLISILKKLNTIIPYLPRDDTWETYTIVLAVLEFLAIVAVAMRVYIRSKRKKLGAEDWVCVVVLGVITAWMGSVDLHMKYTGRHVYMLSIAGIKKHQILMFVNGIIYTFCQLLVKLVFLVSYYRLLSNNLYRIAVKVVAGYTAIASCLIPLLCFIFSCKPIDFWNHLMTAKCIDEVAASSYGAVVYIIADFATLGLAVPIMLKPKLERWDKILLAGLFGLGLFICISSILRLIKLREWLNDPDFTYSFGPYLLWSALEVVLSLVVACVPTLKQGLSHLLEEDEMKVDDPVAAFSGWSLAQGQHSRQNSNAGRKSGEGEVVEFSIGKDEITAQRIAESLNWGTSSLRRGTVDSTMSQANEMRMAARRVAASNSNGREGRGSYSGDRTGKSRKNSTVDNVLRYNASEITIVNDLERA